LANTGDKNRYMFKFQFVRMTMPTAGPSWQSSSVMWPVQKASILQHPLMPVWNYIWEWMRGEGISQSSEEKVDLSPLLQALQDASLNGEIGRLHSAYTLARTSEDSVTRLCKFLIHAQEPVFRTAGYGLAATSDKFAHIAIAGLIKASEHAILENRANAIFFLGELGSRGGFEGIPPVLSGLDSEVQILRRNASEALGNILAWVKDTPVLELSAISKKLCELLLNDQDDQVRFQTALTLGRSGKYLSPHSEAPVLGLIIESLGLASQRDRCRYTQAYALDALQRIGTPLALDFVLKSLWTSRWCSITTPSSPF